MVIDGKIGFTGRHQPLRRVHQPHLAPRPLEGHSHCPARRRRAQPDADVFADVGRQLRALYARSLQQVSRVPQPAHEKEAGYVIPYGDSPLDRDLVGEMVYMDIINRANRYVHIMTPYLIIDNEMITALNLRRAPRRGGPAHPAACA